jgi:hypothetical protein
MSKIDSLRDAIGGMIAKGAGGGKKKGLKVKFGKPTAGTKPTQATKF